MKFLSAFSSLLLALALLPAGVPSPVFGETADTPLTAYHAKSGDFSLPVPSAWDIQENAVIQGYKIPFIALRPSAGDNDPFQDNLNVTLEAIPADMNTGDYLAASVKVMSQALTDFKVLQTGDLKGGFAGAKYMIYTHHTGVTQKLEVISFFFTKNSKGYVTTCTSTTGSFPKFYPLYWKIGSGFAPGK